MFVFPPGIFSADTNSSVGEGLLLISYDGSFNDFYGHTINLAGSPIISSSIKKFGTGSGNFNGSDALQIYSGDFIFATEFTFETWLRLDVYPPSRRSIFGTCITEKTGAFGFNVNTDGTLNIDEYGFGNWYNSSTSIVDNQWHHIAFSRNASSGIYVFVDGISQGVIPVYTTVGTSDGFSIATRSSGNAGMYAYFDETLITNYGKYSGNFSVPTLPYT